MPAKMTEQESRAVVLFTAQRQAVALSENDPKYEAT
jgi:hypothetical protein